jgi:hypothetical protein
MGAKIHLYPIERFVFGDDDYYDIDYFDGLVYQTAKIKGSTIKQGIADAIQIDTIYSADGSILSDRAITGDNSNQLLFDQFRQIVFNTNPAPFGTSGFEINSQPTGNLFTVKNAGNGDIILKVTQSGVQINNEYLLPLTDGLAGQFIQTNGSGQLSFASIPAGGDMLKSVYDPNNDGIVESARKEMVGFINKTGATLLKGTIVYLKSSSVSTTFPEALKANASSEATSSKTIGAVFEDVPNDQTGFIVTSGEVDNLDTTAYSIGQRLWLSTTDGLVTTTPPIQPNHSVFIGIVTRSQNINGRILYAIQNGYEIEELHNVLISNPIDGEVLSYDSADQLWKNQSSVIPNQTNLDPVINLLNTPPASPISGDRYRIGTTPTGLWVGQANKIAEWNGSAWIYTTPILDNLVYQTATATTFRFNGSAWSQWAGTPILQNGNTLGGVMRIGTNDNNTVIIKRNNTDVAAFGQNLFSVRGAGGNYGTFNFNGVLAFQNWDLPNQSGTIALTSDITGFIPQVSGFNIARYHIFTNSSPTVFFSGLLSGGIGGTQSGLLLSGSTATKIIRSRFTSGTASGSIAGYRGNGTDIAIGMGFHAIFTFGFADTTFNSSAHNWVGFGNAITFQIGSLTYASSLGNIIGVGNDPTDSTLQIMHNDSTGSAVKIPLSANFPANRTAGTAFTGMYCFELYNDYGSQNVKWRITRIDTGAVEQGTITSSDKPSANTFLSPVVSRCNGSSTSLAAIMDVASIQIYTKY